MTGMKLKYLIVTLWLLPGIVYAQKKGSKREKAESHIDQNFCNTLMFMVGYSRANFVDIKGKELENTNGVARYVSLRGVVGANASNIVNDSVGWRYEGIFYQGTSKKDFAAYYEEYASDMDRCLPHSGYKLTETPNKEKGLENYPDLSYKYQTGEVTIEFKVAYSTVNGVYTATLSVFK
ncbi:MAG: hypothetical protein K0Q79_3312 [Flavipsychrobacter sp.]|jgi:hypothetical protein|nr:hypothetical protein [Flavipsychrobacter sp.]